jgi:hypothetical protein
LNWNNKPYVTELSTDGITGDNDEEVDAGGED